MYLATGDERRTQLDNNTVDGLMVVLSNLTAPSALMKGFLAAALNNAGLAVNVSTVDITMSGGASHDSPLR